MPGTISKTTPFAARTACRKARKNAARRTQREMFDAVCAACGKPTKVPFEPRTDKPIYCSECFAQRRGR